MTTTKNSHGLLQNEVFLSLDSCKNDHGNKAIKYFCANITGGDKRNIFNKFSLKHKFKNKERQLLTSAVLGDGVHIYYYKNVKFIITIIKYKDTPLATDGWTGFHEKIDIFIPKNDKTLEENKTILDDFIQDTSKEYSDKWLDREDEDNKVTIFIWDDYWETLEKSCNRKLSTIYLDGKEQEVFDKIKDFKTPETQKEYNDFGIPYKYNILLHGVPGTGKTSLIFSLASELKMNVAIMTFTSEMNDTILMRCFRRIPENCILVIEDIDTLFESRKKNDELKNNITFSGLLNTTDGIAHVDKQIIIMTTNYPLNLDSALKRPGRIDLSVEFKYSTKSQISTMFHKFLPKQKDNFKAFYNSIKRLKLTSAMLQQFFFSNRHNENINDFVNELEKTCNDNQYESKKNIYS